MIMVARCIMGGACTRQATRRQRRAVTALVVAASALACMPRFQSKGGGEIDRAPARRLATSDIALPAEYQIEAVSSGLTFPTGVTFDDQGATYVVESGYAYGE